MSWTPSIPTAWQEGRDNHEARRHSRSLSSAGSLRLAVGDFVEYKLSNGSAYHVKLANAESVEIARESLIKGDCKKVIPAEENTETTQSANGEKL